MSYCPVCGTQLTDRELEHEGIVPFCPRCGEYRFPMFNIAVSMIVVNESNRKTLLIKQYGKDFTGWWQAMSTAPKPWSTRSCAS